MLDPNLHAGIIKLIIAYTLVGAFVFTVIITCLSLVGWIRFADPTQQRKLFVALIVELVVICLGSFANLLKFDPKQVQKEVQAPLAKTVSTLSNTTAKLEQEKAEISKTSLETFGRHYRSKIGELERVIADYKKFDTPEMRKEYGTEFERAKEKRFQEVKGQLNDFVLFVGKWRRLLKAYSDLVDGQIDALQHNLGKGDETEILKNFATIQRNSESDIDALKTALDGVKQ